MHWFLESLISTDSSKAAHIFCLAEPFVKDHTSQKAVDICNQSGWSVYITLAQQKKNLINIYL